VADPDVVVERSDRPDREGAPRRLEEHVADGFDVRWIVGQIDAGERPVILVCGGADTLRGRQLTRVESVLGGGVAGAAGTARAAVIDGGTNSGVMRLVGAARERDPVAMPVLVGVAPSGQVKPPGDTQLEPNHSHAVLAEADSWGDETPLMFDLAAAIAGRQRVVVVLAGGNDGALDEAVEAVRRRWPVIVIEGTGGIARRLTRFRRLRRKRSRDERLRQVLRDGDIRAFDEDDPHALHRWIAWELGGDESLKGAWRVFAAYDQAANTLRTRFERMQKLILTLGVAGAATGVAYALSEREWLRFFAVVIPSALGLLTTFVAQRGAGRRWILLRDAAEAVKAEIFRYRTGSGDYADDPGGQLSLRLTGIQTTLVGTEAANAPLGPAPERTPPRLEHVSGDGLSALASGQYLSERVEDQLGFYRGRVRRLDRKRFWLQVGSLASGIAGTALAAAGAAPWIAVTTAAAAAFVAYLSILQIDTLVGVYNRAAAQLDAIRGTWTAHPRDAATPASLVDATETVLAGERRNWVQQMDTALRELERDQPKPKRSRVRRTVA
jgi:hypothetical protein